MCLYVHTCVYLIAVVALIAFVEIVDAGGNVCDLYM